MFENVIGHRRTIEELRRTLAVRELPRALIFAGEPFVGKSTIALELARVLTCARDARWDCDCRSCGQQRTLSHAETVLVGPRPFEPEIRRALEAFEREPRKGTAFLALRAVRKLVRRADPFLWPEPRIRAAARIAASLEERLAELEPSEGRPAPWDAMAPRARGTLAKELLADSVKLLAALPADLTPVDLIRALTSWCRVGSQGMHRVVLIEEAHQMGEAARNALLKLLEEPPERAYFLLTTSRRTAMIPTILSRLRMYPVAARSEGEARDVQQRVYRVPREQSEATLHGFFRGADEERARRLDAIAGSFISGALAADEDPAPEESIALLGPLLAGAAGRAAASDLLDRVAEHLRLALPAADTARRERITRISREVERAARRITERNMQPHGAIAALMTACTPMENGIE